MEFSGQYLTHDEFLGLGGTLDPTPFNLLEIRARRIIDNYTMGRLVNLKSQKQEVKLCIFELIKVLGKQDNIRLKSSESVDGVSVSYRQVESDGMILIDIITEFLGNCFFEDGTPYLYTGI